MDLSQALENMVQNVVGPFWHLLFAAGGLMAIFYVLNVGYRLMQASRLPGQSNVAGGEVIAVLVLAAVLLQFGSFLNKVSGSLGMGAMTYGAIDYPGAASFGKLAPAINAVLTIGAMAGGIYAFRGVLMWIRASTGGGHAGQDLGWKGFTHVFGGACMVNIVQLLEHLRQSTGGLW
jgi:hypothetical protein